MLLQRALSDALGVVVHVVTSSQHHWYLQYQPQTVDPAAPEVFLTYVAPIHYNSLRWEGVFERLWSRQDPEWAVGCEARHVFALSSLLVGTCVQCLQRSR
jgi:hypothetical protein